MIRIIREPITQNDLRSIAEQTFGDFVKGVVDVRKSIVALGGELHADDEAALLQDGSAQGDLWGINLYPNNSTEEWIEFDSMINLRPSQGNRSRSVENIETRENITQIVKTLIRPG